MVTTIMQSPAVEDTDTSGAVDLEDRLRAFAQGRDRCLKAAKNLSLWSYFWNVILIGVGALVAAQGAFVKLAGDAAWVTVLFIVFGVITAAGSGYNAFFKPGARSPKFAKAAFEYDRAIKDLQREIWEANDSVDLDAPGGPEALDAKLVALSKAADDRFDALRLEELALYATGPTSMGPAPIRHRSDERPGAAASS